MYSENKNEIGDYTKKGLFGKNIPTLCEDSRNACEGIITKDECYEALKSIKLNKSPVYDGFSVEFYITFWLHIEGHLVEALN